MLGTPASIFSALLLLTGVAKLRRPDETARALAAFGLPHHRLVGFAVGLIEVMVGLLVLTVGGRLLFGVQGILYLAFAIWVAAALRLDVPLASCGCLGRSDTPPYWGHLALDLAAAAISIGAAAQAAGPLPMEPGLETAAQVIVIGAGVLLAWVVIDDGARAHGAMGET